MEEGPFLVQRRHLHPLVVARVEPEDRVDRCLSLGVVIALAAHHVQEVPDHGDAVLVPGRIHGGQGFPLVGLLVVHPELLADHQLLPEDSPQGYQVRAVRADGRPLRLHHRLHVRHHLVIAGLQEQVDAGVVSSHEVHCLDVVNKILGCHQGEPDVLHELRRTLHARLLVAQPATCRLEEFKFSAVLKAIT